MPQNPPNSQTTNTGKHWWQRLSQSELLLIAMVLMGIALAILRWDELWPQVREAFARYFRTERIS